MNLAGILSGSVGIFIIVLILYFMYRHRFNGIAIKTLETSNSKFGRWLANGAYINYYTT